ncbi:MAG: hypothetical protein QNK25_04590, partial [Desulfobacterales bacterium]|nr:hypothetical protein [Desulfobacterales bacterium]
FGLPKETFDYCLALKSGRSIRNEAPLNMIQYIIPASACTSQVALSEAPKDMLPVLHTSI